LNALGSPSSFKALFSAPAPSAAHYHSIDFLRGIAALAILFWHYQGFYTIHPSDVVPPEVLAGQPMYSWFKFLYTKGYYAVQLFWTISGFVFAAVYIGNPSTTREFATARFARLYPLHALTLAVICILELISISLTGDTKCYANFDLYHFILNVFFASGWGLERGFSFNGPVWSVSIEIPIYALFWVTHRRLFRFGILGPGLLALTLLAGFSRHLPGYVWECGFFYFAGTSIYVLHNSLPRIAQFAIAALAFGAGQLVTTSHPYLPICLDVLGAVTLVAAAEPTLGKAAKSLDWVGDNTYSLYLWQIPVQVALLLVIKDTAVYNSPFFLLAYLCGMIVLARASFLCIERPSRRILRSRLAASPAK
jgi:peptidoglycan/LPS O-acetylase OafA/YrhL